MTKDDKKKEIKKEKKAVSTAKVAKVAKKATASTKKEPAVKKEKKEDKVLEKKAVKEKNTTKITKDAKTAKTSAPKKAVTKKVKKKEEKIEKVEPKKESKSTTVTKTAVKKATPQKESTTKKTSSKPATKKAATSKKETTVTSTTAKKASPKGVKKTAVKKAIKATPAENINILEYYDLPYRYDETTVKLLAQTPKVLFVYWDISDKDRENYTNQFGEDFFNNTKPVLIVHNESMDYSFEIDIDDFANCWYIHTCDSSSKYKIELGRRAKVQDYYIPDNYIYVTSSNEIEAPNDHILFENNSMAYFRNVKTGEVTSKNIATLSFMRNMGKIYNIYDMYKQIYKDELDNPSSKPSSGALLF